MNPLTHCYHFFFFFRTDKRDSLSKESFPSVSYSRKAPNEVHLPKMGSRTKRSNLKWIKKGGPGRDEDTQIQINFRKVNRKETFI